MRTLARCLALAYAIGCGAPDIGELADDAPPHGLVLITLDTARADHVDWDDPERLPAIHRAFAGGLRFDQAVAVSPVTGPSHASMLTGLLPLEHRLLSNPLPLSADRDTLAEALRHEGYRTAAFVSCSVLAAGRGFDQGYEHYDSQLGPEYIDGYHERSAWHTTDRALAWLRENDDAPFHLWVHYFDAHAPYDPPGPHRPGGYGELERSPELHPDVARLHALHEAGEVDPRLREWYRALYAGELRAIDAEFARLVGYLESRPYARRVAIVLAGDHGEALADDGSYFEHARSLEEGVMRVPLALAGPGIEARRVAHQVSHASVAATLLELGGAPVPDGLAPSLRAGAEAHAAGQVMLKEPHPIMAPFGAALRQPPWKYVYWEDGSAALYDLDADPQTRHDLSARHAERARRMRAAIEAEILPALGSREMPAIDAATREMLHALGYAELEDPP